MLTTLRQLFLFLLSQRYALHNTEVKWAAQSHTVSERSQEASNCRPRCFQEKELEVQACVTHLPPAFAEDARKQGHFQSWKRVGWDPRWKAELNDVGTFLLREREVGRGHCLSAELPSPCECACVCLCEFVCHCVCICVVGASFSMSV